MGDELVDGRFAARSSREVVELLTSLPVELNKSSVEVLARFELVREVAYQAGNIASFLQPFGQRDILVEERVPTCKLDAIPFWRRPKEREYGSTRVEYATCRDRRCSFTECGIEANSVGGKAVDVRCFYW